MKKQKSSIHIISVSKVLRSKALCKKKAQQKIEKILFRKAVASTVSTVKKTETPEKKQTKKTAAIQGLKKPKNLSADKKKEKPLPVYRFDLSAILNKLGDRALEKAFIRLVDKVFLPRLRLATEKKRRFAKEIINNIKTFSAKQEGHFCEECLDKVPFQDFEMRLAFCEMLKTTPSLLDFISFKKTPLYFYNLPSEILEALFGQEALDGILELQKKKKEKGSPKEMLKGLLRSAGALDYEKEHFIDKMRFTKRGAPDKKMHLRIRLDKKGQGLWRASPGGLSGLWSGIED